MRATQAASKALPGEAIVANPKVAVIQSELRVPRWSETRGEKVFVTWCYVEACANGASPSPARSSCLGAPLRRAFTAPDLARLTSKAVGFRLFQALSLRHVLRLSVLLLWLADILRSAARVCYTSLHRLKTLRHIMVQTVISCYS
jgi:hypothetical protein